MADRCLAACLRDVVAVFRRGEWPGADENAGAPSYAEVAHSVPCRLRPEGGSWSVGRIGPLDGIRFCGYLEPGDVRPGDLLVQRGVGTALATAVPAGGVELVLEDAEALTGASQVCIGSGQDAELACLSGLADGCGALAGPLAMGHPVGSEVAPVVVYEVLHVLDVGGAGHHLKAELLQRQT